jgi:hypothetical protein
MTNYAKQAAHMAKGTPRPARERQPATSMEHRCSYNGIDGPSMLLAILARLFWNKLTNARRAAPGRSHCHNAL